MLSTPTGGAFGVLVRSAKAVVAQLRHPGHRSGPIIGGAGFNENGRMVVVAFLGYRAADRKIHGAGFTPVDLVQDSGNGHFLGVVRIALLRRFGEG